MTITVIASSLNLWEGLKIAFSSALFEKKTHFSTKIYTLKMISKKKSNDKFS